MQFKEFIYQELKNLAQSFKQVKIKYGYDLETETHIVEITPQSQYYNNPSLDEAWMRIMEISLSRYPEECISFVSDDSILAISFPEYSFNVEKEIKAHSWLEVFKELYFSSDALTPELWSSSSFMCDISETTVVHSHHVALHHQKELFNNNVCEIGDMPSIESEAPSPNTQYAMAA